jgi:hypothetical protein
LLGTCITGVFFANESIIVHASITVYTDTSREENDGQIILVPRASSLGIDEWRRWLAASAYLVILFLAGCLLIGPITAAGVLTLGTLRRHRLSEFLKTELELSLDQQAAQFSLLGIGAFLWLVCWKAVPLVLGPYLGIALSGLALAMLVLCRVRLLAAFGVDHTRWPVPQVTRPYVYK